MTTMKRTSTIFLQVVIVLIGIAALAFLLVEPHFEGRNVNAALFQVYFNDPFLAYVYVASIAFFMALYQAFKVLRRVRQGGAFSQETAKALRTIRYCAIAFIGFVIGGEIIILSSPTDDRPPVLMVGFLVTLGSIAVACTASRQERKSTS